MTRKSKPARSCPMCKFHKWLGNGRERNKPSVLRQLDATEVADEIDDDPLLSGDVRIR